MRSRAILASGLALTLLGTACAGAGDVQTGDAADLDVAPGVTDDTVLIGTHQPLTGPAAPGYSQISAGAQAVYDFINDNGGVNGRQIDYRVEDDGYDPSRTIDVTRELVLEDEIFAMVGGLGTPTHDKVIDFLNEEGVPDLFVSSGALMWNNPEEHPLTYGYQVDYTREAKIQGKFIAENFPDASVGYFYQNDDVGEDAQNGLDQYLGEEVVSRQHYETEVTDVGPQIAELERQGAEVVVCSCIPAFMALALLEAASIGYEPTWVVSSIGADTATLKGLLSQFTQDTEAEGVPADAFLDGLLTTGYLPQVEMVDDPWTQFFSAVWEEYGGEAPLTNTTVYGMAQAVMFAQVLKAAGPDLTRQALIDALQEREYKGPGLVPFSTAADDHAGFTGAFVSEYQADGQPEMQQEPMVTDREGGEIAVVDFERPLPEEIDFYDGE